MDIEKEARMTMYRCVISEGRAFWVIAVAYLSLFILLTSMTGHLSRLGEESLFFNPLGDGPGYKEIADYYTSLGNSTRPSDFMLEIRPFLYPLFIGLYRVIGVAGLQMLQVALNVVSLWLLFISIKTLSGRSWVAGLCTSVLALIPTFNFIALNAYSETLSLFLICVFIAFAVDHFQHHNQSSLFMAGFAVSLFACVRPVAMPFWFVFAAYCGIAWLRDCGRRVWQPALVLAPVLCQVLISLMLTGPTTGVAGSSSLFSRMYFPAVYGQKEYGRFIGRKTPEAQEALTQYPGMKEQFRYVIENYPTAINTYVSLLLGENLMAGSNFVGFGVSGQTGNQQAVLYLRKWSAKLNRLFALGHAFMLVVMMFGVITGSRIIGDRAILAFYVFAILLLLPTGFVYWQGDRYVVLTAPLWLVAYGTLSSRLIEHWSGQVSTNLMRA
jgi:hypothetical protein